jgi:hypothetical protein
MKKVLLNAGVLSLLAIAPLCANETQVFSSNSKRIVLDKNTTLTEMFVGSTKEFSENQNDIYNSDIVKQTVVAAAFATAGAAAVHGTFEGLDSNGGLIGVGLMLTVGAGLIAYNVIVEDYEYVYLTIATNSAHEVSILKTLVVSNDEITNSEVKNLALKHQQTLIQ